MSINSKSKAKKLIKKKQHEREAKNKVLIRRESLRKNRKEEKIKILQQIESDKIINGQQKPFRNNQDLRKTIDDRQQKMAKQQLEHNLKILKALEEEYQKEDALRKEINQSFDEKGITSIKDKLDELHKLALKQAGDDVETTENSEDQKN